MNIGLTGGIACGKSTVSDMFVRRGAKLIDIDLIAREIVQPGKPAFEEIAGRFGNDILLPDGTLNRKKLAEIVFQNKECRLELERITHPLIRCEMSDRMAQYEQSFPDKLVVVDVPLLIESNLQSYFQQVVLVYIPRPLQKQRLMVRDQISAEQAEHRLNAQMPIEEKKKLADYVIDNSGSLEETERQVDRCYEWLANRQASDGTGRL